jgi:aminoglycoside phosphotransferase (APT) family kinase protein
MTDRADAVAARLRAVLDARWAAWRVGDLALVGNGLEAAVFRAPCEAFGDVAIRVPWTRWISNDNDRALDARALLTKEHLLANHMHGHGVPTPRAFALHCGEDDFDFLVSAYVLDDGSAEDRAALGAVLRAIHAAPVSAEVAAALDAGHLADTLVDRLTQRLAVVARLSGAALPAVSAAALREVLAGARYEPRVVHMDVRRTNIRVERGAVRAIFDWSNALLGDPALDLARAAEYGVRDAAFDAGYGARPEVAPEVDAIYRLDTAVMLAVVFLSEDPDPAAAVRQVARVEALLAALEAP